MIKGMIKNVGLVVSAGVILCGMSACMETDVVNPNGNQPKGEKIVLDLSSESMGLTRADANHVLRYKATLFLGSPSNVQKNTRETKELIEDSQATNQIIFNVETGKDYVIYVFADYIPKENVRADGQNIDQYYDTSMPDNALGRYTMLTTPGNATSLAISADFFNNDNYDCFYGYVSGNKPEEEVRHDMKLTRAVGKVVIGDISGNKGTFDVSVSKLGIYRYFDVVKDMTNANGRGSYYDNSGFSNMVITHDKNIANGGSDSAPQELFYFYAFANGKDNSNKTYAFLTFNLKGSDVAEKTYVISDNVIQVQKNFITTLKGNFVVSNSGNNGNNGGNTGNGGNDDNGGNSGDNTGGDNTGGGTGSKAGPVILDLSTVDSWESTYATFNQ